jgi:hypothetical protein
MIAYPWTPADAQYPQVEEARLMPAQNHAREMDCHTSQQREDRPKNQEKLGTQDAVDDEEAVSHAGKHLRTRERDKHCVTAKVA